MDVALLIARLVAASLAWSCFLIGDAAAQSAPKSVSDRGVQVVYDSNSRGGLEEQPELGREILRRVVKVRPQLLDDPDIMQRWLRELAYGTRAIWPDPAVIEMHDQYAKGTEFDQARVIARFRKFLTDRATSEPLRVVRIRVAGLGRYDAAGKEFPLLNLRNDQEGFSDRMWIRSGNLPSVNVRAGVWTGVTAMPLALDAAEIVAKTLGQLRLIEVAVDMTLDAFRVADEDASGSSISATAKVNEVSFHYMSPTRKDRAKNTIAKSAPQPDDDRAPRQARSEGSAQRKPAETWARHDVPLQNDRIVFAPVDTLRGPSAPHHAFKRAVEVMTVARWPFKVNDMEEILYFAQNFLKPSQRVALFGSRQPSVAEIMAINNDRNRLAGIAEEFQKSPYDDLVLSSPQLPIRMRLVIPAEIGRYDARQSTFPLSYETRSYANEQGLVVELMTNLKLLLPYRELPRIAKLSDEQANAVDKQVFVTQTADIRGGYPQQRGKVWLSVDLVLDALLPKVSSLKAGYGSLPIVVPQKSTLPSYIIAKVENRQLYADERLQAPVSGIALEQEALPEIKEQTTIQEWVHDGGERMIWSCDSFTDGKAKSCLVFSCRKGGMALTHANRTRNEPLLSNVNKGKSFYVESSYTDIDRDLRQLFQMDVQSAIMIHKAEFKQVLDDAQSTPIVVTDGPRQFTYRIDNEASAASFKNFRAACALD